MPIYEYKGLHYDIDTDDTAAAKAKILGFLGSQGQPAPAPVAPAPVAAPAPTTAPEPNEQPDAYDYTRLAKDTKYQAALPKDGRVSTFNYEKGDVTPNISNTFYDRKGVAVTRNPAQSDADWAAMRAAREAEPASTFARPGDTVAPRWRDLSAPAPAPTKATPVAQRPAAQSFLPPQAPKPEPDKSFSPVEEATKGVVGAATVGIPSSVEQFKLAGSAEVLGNTIQRLQLLDKIDKGEIKSPNDLPRDPQARAYFASGPDVRSRLRESINNDLTKNQEFVNASLSLLAQYQREGEKYKGRQEKVLESESAADFGNWLTNKIGAGAVYAVPSIIAAITAKQPGLFVLGTGMGYTEAVGNRLEVMAKELKSLPPEQRAARVAQRLQETNDVNVAVAIASGALDTVLGPAASIVKQGVKGSIEAMGRKGATKEALKELPKQAGEEFVAGSLQEGAQAAGKVQTGERAKFATAETAKEMFESGAAEAAGSLGPTAGIGAIRVARTPSAEKTTVEDATKIEPTLEPETEQKQEQPAPPIDKRQALKDALAKRMKPAVEEQSAPPTVVSEAAPIKEQATPEQIKKAAAILERRGIDPVDALRIATARLGGTPEVTETNAPIEEGAEDVTKPISEAGGESPAVSAQSADDVSTAAGVGEAKRNGMVSTRPDVTESTEGKGTEPVAVKEAPFEMRSANNQEQSITSGAVATLPLPGGAKAIFTQNGDGDIELIAPNGKPDKVVRAQRAGHCQSAGGMRRCGGRSR